MVAVGLVALVVLASAGMRAANDLETRTARLQQADNMARVAIARAEAAALTDAGSWDAAADQCELVEDLMASWKSDGEVELAARQTVRDFAAKKTRWQLAVQLEETLINNATQPDLASWQAMEEKMRTFFRENGFDLDEDDPAAIGRRIRDDVNQEHWSDLLELWIGTRAHMSQMGGSSTDDLQPWADAIYVADTDPVRTSIRKFIYTPPYKRETLEGFARGIDPTKLSARTLTWLAGCWGMVGATDECATVFETALEQYPRDVMVAFDYGLFLVEQERHQEAARMFHRCLVLRNDVSSLWTRLAITLKELGEDAAAAKAFAKAASLE